jgi:hypothetical protein
MKKFVLILTLAALPCICLLVAKEPKRIVVPRGKTYVVLNAKGKATATYTSGQQMAGMNCVQIACPDSFKEGTVCWHCDSGLAQ